MPVNGDEEDLRVRVKLLLRTVSMMNILTDVTRVKTLNKDVHMCIFYPIQDKYSFFEESSILFRSDGHIIEEAEAQRLIMLCVVTRRANEGDSVAQNTSSN